MSLWMKSFLNYFASKKILLNTLLNSKNLFEIMTLADNLVLIYRFQDHNLVLCSLNTFCDFFFAKIWFVETSTRVMKYELRTLMSNPVKYQKVSK